MNCKPTFAHYKCLISTEDIESLSMIKCISLYIICKDRNNIKLLELIRLSYIKTKCQSRLQTKPLAEFRNFLKFKIDIISI